MKLADKIRRGRKLTGMSKLQLAQAINVQRSTVTNWEGADDITSGVDRLRRLASILNVSFEWLVAGRGEFGLPRHIHVRHHIESKEIVMREAARFTLLAIACLLPDLAMASSDSYSAGYSFGQKIGFSIGQFVDQFGFWFGLFAIMVLLLLRRRKNKVSKFIGSDA